jgi:hypothetical protein
MRLAVIAMMLLASACGGPKTTSDPAAQNVIDATSRGTPAAVAAGTCNGKPDFVPVYDDSKVISCTNGDVTATGRRSGTVLYTSFASPSTILTWSKQRAIASGLSLRIEDGGSFSAGEGERTLRVMATADATHTRVTVNWGMKD